MVKNPFEIEEEENADAEEEMDDDGSSSGGSDVSRKGKSEPCHGGISSKPDHLILRCLFCDWYSRN